MAEFKKIFRYIVFTIAITIAVVATCLEAVMQPDIIEKFNNPPSKEDYDILKEYAVSYTKTLSANAIADKSVEISHEWKEDNLIITVNTLACGLMATYPIELKVNSEYDGGYVRTIVYEEAKYEEYSNLHSQIFYIIVIIFCFFTYTFLSYIIIYYPITFIVDKINSIVNGTSKK